MSNPLELSPPQVGVAKGMAFALVTVATGFILTDWYWAGTAEAWASTADRLHLLATALLFPGLTLMFCIGRLAKHRFFTPEDIDGGALTPGTATARLLQALLQNTLEQLVIAIIAYFSAGMLLAPKMLPLVPAAALMFTLGRVLFFRGYQNGAAHRAFGFALTFYSSVALMLLTVSMIF